LLKFLIGHFGFPFDGWTQKRGKAQVMDPSPFGLVAFGIVVMKFPCTETLNADFSSARKNGLLG
jgi:hypothetical protein